MKKQKYQEHRKSFWNEVAHHPSIHGKGSAGYHKRLIKIFQFHISKGQKVLEIGCGEGNLLATVNPSYGLGIDISPEMIQRAKLKYPDLDFRVADGLDFNYPDKFDIIILSDLINDVWDVQLLFENIHKHTHPGSRILINYYSRVWAPVLKLASVFNLAQKTLKQNWLVKEDIENLLYLSNFDIIRTIPEILLPIQIPLLADLCNRYLVRFFPFTLYS